MAVANIAVHLLLATLLATSTYAVGPSYVQVQLFQKGDCKGWRQDATLDRQCRYYPSLEKEISGVKIPTGSCAIIMKERCAGSTTILGYPSSNYCVLPCCGWNDKIKGVKDCNTRTKSISCPQGTYVREVACGGATAGLTLYCYDPLRTTSSYFENTHGKTITNPSKKNCPIAAFGMSATWSSSWRIYTTPSLSCRRQSKTAVSKTYSQGTDQIRPMNTPGIEHFDGLEFNLTMDEAPTQTIQADCSGQHEAPVGLSVTIDQRDVIKELSVRCRKVVDPATMCEPLEQLRTVISCDNSKSGNELTCTYSRTVGVSKSTSLTETEKREWQWSSEVGYTVSNSMNGLSSSMSAKLGQSHLVGYQWSKQDTETWTVQTTVSASIKVRPYAYSVLEQLTAKCSFYGVQTTYFRQRDIINGTTTYQYFTV